MLTVKEKDIIEGVIMRSGAHLAYVFGSQAQMTAMAQSDIDVAILLPSKYSPVKRFDIRTMVNEELAVALHKPVDVVILNDTTSLFFKYIIIKEGVLIYESSEDQRVSFESMILSEYFDYEPFLIEYNTQYVKRNIQ